MNNILTVRNVVIGEGVPKICVPIVGTTAEQIIEEAVFLKTLDFDIAEWRADFFEHVENIEKVKEVLGEIRKVLLNTPLIFTFRSAKEGGEKEISTQYYIELNKEIAESKLADIIDVELFTGEQVVKELVEAAHKTNVLVIISNHDFEKTPPKMEIITRLRKAVELGADLPKIAVMPTCSKDVLTLLEATTIMYEEYADKPIVTMSMAGKGMISRLGGEIFGSALTFGAAQTASAPGQVPIKELRSILHLIHANL